MKIPAVFKPNVEKLKKNKDINGLIKALDSKDEKVQKEVIIALEELGDFALESLNYILQDIDSNIRLDAAEALGRIQKSGVAILRGGLIKYVNHRVSKINGYSKHFLLEKQFVNFVADEYKETVLERYKKRVTYDWAPSKYEIEILSKEGGKIRVEINASLIEYQGRAADLVLINVIK